MRDTFPVWFSPNRVQQEVDFPDVNAWAPLPLGSQAQSCVIFSDNGSWRWRKRVGVEPTGVRGTRRPPVLKITQCVLTRYENPLLYLILQLFTRNEFCHVLIYFGSL